jgi:hypothetical protein
VVAKAEVEADGVKAAEAMAALPVVDHDAAAEALRLAMPEAPSEPVGTGEIVADAAAEALRLAMAMPEAPSEPVGARKMLESAMDLKAEALR